MRKLYTRWMEDWERRLCFRTDNRRVRPFEWGIEWAEQWPVARQCPGNGHEPQEYLRLLNRLALADSDAFFAYRTPSDFARSGSTLTFTSPVVTPYPDNNLVRARWFEARGAKGAVVLLPHWNAHQGQHVALPRALRLLGISTLRITLPYHEERMPPELERADYAVSPNIARTIDATRQAVVDVRSCFDWLEMQGYTRLGMVGTSLGSCYAFLASAHDSRVRANVYNHCSCYFADVVWTGLSTRHVRSGLDGTIGLEGLREVWMAISPANYLRQYARWPKKSKFIFASYDSTFLPELSRSIVDAIRAAGIDHDVLELPCGHYTLGETPFKFIDGYQICAFLKRWL
ncbi:MAG: alpha/beta hydrolase family protein [Acidobacteria bacterium]|nr:alpha/beta hydrolase family protein [Acidobacteriota bacterium]